MSCTHKYRRKSSLVVALGILLLCSSTLSAQGIPPGIMVCQTQAFWCTVASPDYPTGTPCWCNLDQWGSRVTYGYAINPRQVVMQTGATGDAPDPDVIDLGSHADDCLNGLGNCDGSFKSLVRKKSRSAHSKQKESADEDEGDQVGDEDDGPND